MRYLTHPMTNKVLITGADGFIGSHLTEALVRAGHQVKAFVLYNSFNSWGWLDHCAADVRGQFEVFAGDIRDPHGVHTAMTGCDAVLHLALLAHCQERGIGSFSTAFDNQSLDLLADLGLENVTAKRPGTGLSPMRWDEVMGRVAGRDYRVDDLIVF